MAGKSLRQASKSNFSDPFVAGQMIGMLVMLTFIENNNGIGDDTLQQLKKVTAASVEEYLNKPTEDIFLMVENMVKDIEQS